MHDVLLQEAPCCSRINLNQDSAEYEPSPKSEEAGTEPQRNVSSVHREFASAKYVLQHPRCNSRSANLQTNFPLALNRSPVAANRDGEKIRNVDDLDQESRYEDIYRRGGGGADHTALAASTYSSTVNSSISEGSLSSSRPLARDAGAFDRTAQKKRLGDLRENYRRLRPLSALVTGRRRTAGRSREYGSLLSDSSGDFLKGKSNSRDEITRMVENSEITRLDLGGFSWLESSFLDMLGQKCGATLRHVNLSGCNVSNLAVQCLGASCPQLSELDLSRCNKISADILTLTIPSWPLLRLLCLTGCDQLFKRVRGSGEDGHGGDDDASYYHHYGFSKEEVAAKILQHGAVYGWTVEKKGPGKQAHVDGGRTPGTNSKMSDREMAGASAPEVGDDEDRGDDEAAIQAEELAIALEIQQRDDAFQMFSALARTAPMLEELNLDSCPSLQSWQFAGFVRPDGQPMALRKVGLSCCTALEGATLQQLSENCPGLESVSLRLCDQNGMTPESVSL